MRDVVASRMATLDFVRIKARDGLDLPIWVTRPRKDAPGLRDGKRAAVVLVHGGPWLRGGNWTWHGDAQFLASRGYVVIEPEFRGSTGYWGGSLPGGMEALEGAMQDDVADALRAIAAEGVIDPKRVCIAGGSYGGYATLMGLIRYPELYPSRALPGSQSPIRACCSRTAGRTIRRTRRATTACRRCWAIR